MSSTIMAGTRSHTCPGFRRYLQPRVLVMLALGFSSGLPFLLSGNTFGYWLRDEGTSLTAIGFISWVGLAYSFKFLWAPLIDRVKAPLLGGLGQRRGWMLIAQAAIVAGLVAMAMLGTAHGLVLLGACALVVAFSSATQDIVIDAWRIESADNEEELGLLSSALQLGYRVALLVTDALILIAAEHVGWSVSYIACGVLMAVGIAATMLAVEPARADAVVKRKAQELPLLFAARNFRCDRRPFHRVLSHLRLACASDSGGHRSLSHPRFHHGADGQSLLSRHRPHEDLCGQCAGFRWAGRGVARHRSRGLLCIEVRQCVRALIVGGVFQALAMSARLRFAFASGKANLVAVFRPSWRETISARRSPASHSSPTCPV